MAELIHSSSLKRRERPDVAQKRISAFHKRFGEAHLLLAQHAAFPLAFTPDLLYRLWANFQRDIHGKKLNIPWVAVADLLLSPLCIEVGQELYEMDITIRNGLLKALQTHPSFGQQRIEELSSFLLDYVKQQLHSNDPDMREFAQVQRWTALAYTQPTKAAHELAKAMAELDQNDKVEKIRIASLIETFAEPLSGFAPLITYARGVGLWARGDVDAARQHLSAITATKQVEHVLNVSLPMPEVDNFHTWRELLGSIIQDGHESQRIAQEIGVNPITLIRWVTNALTPQPIQLHRLMSAVPPHYQSSMLDLLRRDFPSLSFTIPGTQEHEASANMKSIELFCVYAHEDASLKQELDRYLSFLIEEGAINGWHDYMIMPGMVEEQDLDRHISTAKIILVLVSAHFVSSSYFYGSEMRTAVERHEAGDARVIPIILHPCLWKSGPFAKLLVLPEHDRPISQWSTRRQAFLNITDGIFQAVEELKVASRGKTQKTSMQWKEEGDYYYYTGEYKKALAIYESVLGLLVLEDFPAGYADIHRKLGNIYHRHNIEKNKQNQKYAISHYQEALRVYTLDSSPSEWAQVQSNLGDIFRERIEGDRKNNLEQALAYYQQALKFYTPLTHFEEYSRIQDALRDVNIQLTSLENTAPLEKASDIQRKIYEFIVEYIKSEGMPPTNREIGRAFNIASTGHVDFHLTMLEKKGLITRQPKKKRGIELTKTSQGIPVVGVIATDEPLDIFTDTSQTIEAGSNLIESENAYALVVRGDAMIEDHILDGDYVVVKPQSTCENGDIIVAVHVDKGEAILRKFFKGHDEIRLQPANPEVKAILLSVSEWESNWQVQGKVIVMFRSPKNSSDQSG